MSTARTSDYPIAPAFLERWSPRAFGPRPVTREQVLTMLEAARWAPSGSNLQPWRFIYALKGTPEFDTLLSLLVPFNQGWAYQAGALVFIASVTTFDGTRPIATHSFDAGSAFMSMTLQAHSMGLIVHGMGGIEFDKAPQALGLPSSLKLEAAAAIGYQGDAATLPEALRERETPSQRQPLSAMVFEGRFSGEPRKPD